MKHWGLGIENDKKEARWQRQSKRLDEKYKKKKIEDEMGNEKDLYVTPRAKAKAKSGPSPKRLSPMASPKRPSLKASPMKLEPVPIFPDGRKTSCSRDQPKYDNPESEHEPKGKPGRPSNTQPTNQVPPVKKKQQPPNTPNMTPIGTIASQKPTGTRNPNNM